jgi:tetratricopeptide (TPR) repeat protein
VLPPLPRRARARAAGRRSTGDRRQLYNPVVRPCVLQEDLAEGRRSVEEAADIYRELGDDNGLVNALWALGNASFFAEEWLPATEEYQEALELARRMGNAFMTGWSLHMLGGAETRLRRFASAHEHLSEALRMMLAARETTGIVLALDDFAELANALGDIERSFRLEGAARSLQEETGAGLAGFANEALNRVYVSTGDLRPDEIERLRAEGRALTTEAAVALALDTRVPDA